MSLADAGSPAPDLKIGSFTDRGPWVVVPEEMTWRGDVDRLRNQAREQLPRWVEPSRLPPVGRLVRVVTRVGSALLIWAVTARGKAHSRADLSRRLRIAFGHLGPTYIKLGQIVSGGEGLFPEELVSEFKLLRDRVPAEPFDAVRRVVEMDLGHSLDDIFERFERSPIAAASIAQVHAAKLRTGEDVVVKVQRPQIARLVQQDIAAMAWLAPHMVGRIPIAALANPPALIELFAETIVEELDFRLEAENMLDIARVLAETEQRATIVPRPHPELVTKRVLVMERLDGIPWDDVASMHAAGVDTEAVLHAGLVSFMEGAMLFGVFHGDLHGGNLMVRPDGRTVLMDFGITGRLDEKKRLAFLLLLVGATSGDTMGQLGALRDLGAFPPDTDLDGVFRDLGLDRTIDPTTLSADELVHELQDLTKKLLEYGARAPKELMLFVKNMMFLDGAIARLAPDLDILGEIQKVHTEIALRHGERLAAELGLDPSMTAEFDMNAIKAAMGVPDVETLTYRDVQERREIIRRRFEEKKKK
ncbi:MAG TPA: AarF/UbiB family protein [Acidimicrobiia bacterium]|jgi:ubiquinone biosynthesis protein|nr:AarF/UbiB family protein [Acidimicrobiia bacterium]